MFENCVILEGQRQMNFAVSPVAAQSEPLSPGIYDCWADVETYVEVDANALDVTLNSGYVIRAGVTISIRIIGMNSRIGAISAATGTFRFHKVSQ